MHITITPEPRDKWLGASLGFLPTTYQRAEYYRTLLRHLAAAHSPLAAANHYQQHRYFMGTLTVSSDSPITADELHRIAETVRAAKIEFCENLLPF